MPELTREQIIIIIANCIECISGDKGLNEIVQGAAQPLKHFGIGDRQRVRLLTGLLSTSDTKGLPSHGGTVQVDALKGVTSKTRITDLVAMLLPGHEDFSQKGGGGGDDSTY